MGNNKGRFPTLGQNVHLMSGAKILGDSHIGDHVTIAANTYVKDAEIPPHTFVFGSSPNLILKPVNSASA
jgi:serine O-acetyltransferase